MQPYPVERARALTTKRARPTFNRPVPNSEVIIKCINEEIEAAALHGETMITIEFKRADGVSIMEIESRTLNIGNLYWREMLEFIQSIYERDYVVTYSEHRIDIEWYTETMGDLGDPVEMARSLRNEGIDGDTLSCLALNLYSITRFKPLKYIAQAVRLKCDGRYLMLRSYHYQIMAQAVYCGVPCLFGTKLPVDLIRKVRSFV